MTSTSKRKSQKIAVFGGTFDPPHIGHINIALSVIQKKYADKILFIPSAKPPHKRDIPTSDFFHRLNMLKLAIRNYPEFEISLIEYERLPQPSYTLVTLRSLKNIYANAEILFLMGTDSLLALHTWYKAYELVEEYEFLIYPRSGYEVKEKFLRQYWNEKIIKKLMTSILPVSTYDISSTQIREYFQKSHVLSSPFSNYIIPTVAEYILQNKLYHINDNVK